MPRNEADTYYQASSFWRFAATVTMDRYYVPSDASGLPTASTSNPTAINLMLNVTVHR